MWRLNLFAENFRSHRPLSLSGAPVCGLRIVGRFRVRSGPKIPLAALRDALVFFFYDARTAGTADYDGLFEYVGCRGRDVGACSDHFAGFEDILREVLPTFTISPTASI